MGDEPMTQDRIFLEGEADRWFKRNLADISRADRPDWPLRILARLEGGAGLGSFLELGCSNGWRLGRLRELFGAEKRYAGVDPSAEALMQGRSAFPGVEFHRGTLSEVPLAGAFDVVIVNFVLHWVDRSSLARSIAEIDRLVADGGYLVLGDFLPDFPQKRAYHHLEGGKVFTYKQDYPRVFASLGTYREIVRIAHEHSGAAETFAPVDSADRAVCSLLRKSLSGHYPEMG
jgi:SAM-dependent methyltransferase